MALPFRARSVRGESRAPNSVQTEKGQKMLLGSPDARTKGRRGGEWI